MVCCRRARSIIFSSIYPWLKVEKYASFKYEKYVNNLPLIEFTIIIIYGIIYCATLKVQV